MVEKWILGRSDQKGGPMLKDACWRLFTSLVRKYGYPIPGIKGEVALGLMRLSL